VTLRFDEDRHRMFECLRTGKPMAQPTKDTGVRAATIRTWAHRGRLAPLASTLCPPPGRLDVGSLRPRARAALCVTLPS
jgi:hypothetical protein